MRNLRLPLIAAPVIPSHPRQPELTAGLPKKRSLAKGQADFRPFTALPRASNLSSAQHSGASSRTHRPQQ
jgi:hypothetical protein